MSMFEIWAILSIFLFIATLPGTLELILLTFGAIFSIFQKSKVKHGERTKKVIVVVPAHQEENGIRQTLSSLQACTGTFTIVVIADNCTDGTSQIAKNMGIRVLERNDPVKKGKNYALEYAFSILLKEDYELFAVIDADTIVEPNFISEISQVDGDLIQVRYGQLHTKHTMKSRRMHLAFLAFNYLRPLGRQYWGFSSGIFGNGYAIRRKTLEANPLIPTSIVEDLAYHIDLIRNGYKVQFTDQTAVFSEIYVNNRGFQTQRARWEGGRLRTVLDYTPVLIKEIFSGKLQLIEPLLDLLLPPLSYYAALLIVLLFSPMSFIQWYAVASIGILLIHLFVASKLGKGTFKEFLLLILSAPYYIFWKLMQIPKIIAASKKGFEWKRTDRTNKE